MGDTAENASVEFRARTRIDADGRLTLPKAMRDAAGLRGETDLILTFKDGRIQMSTVEENVRRAQELFRKHVKHDFSSDDFLATRERD